MIYFLFHRPKLCQQQRFNCFLVNVIGYNERPLFVLNVWQVHQPERTGKVMTKRNFSKGTQHLQVYKLLVKWDERKPFGPEVDMSFCSPQPDLLPTSAQTQKTLCSKWYFTSRLVTLSSSWVIPPPHPLLSGRKPFNSPKLKASKVLHSDLEGLLTPWCLSTRD